MHIHFIGRCIYYKFCCFNSESRASIGSVFAAIHALVLGSLFHLSFSLQAFDRKGRKGNKRLSISVMWSVGCFSGRLANDNLLVFFSLWLLADGVGLQWTTLCLSRLCLANRCQSSMCTCLITRARRCRCTRVSFVLWSSIPASRHPNTASSVWWLLWLPCWMSVLCLKPPSQLDVLPALWLLIWFSFSFFTQELEET